jgi:hypothetical protein
MSLTKSMRKLYDISDSVSLDQASSFLNTILVVTTLQIGITIGLVSTVDAEIPYEDNGCNENTILKFWILNAVSSAVTTDDEVSILSY